MKKYVPERIDFDNIIYNPTMTQIKGYHPDKVKWILAEVAEMPTAPSGFAEIHSKRFKSYVNNYKDYLDCLSALGVIEMDMSFSYELAHKVRGYRFTDQHSTTLQGMDIEYFPIIKKAAKGKAFKLSTCNKNKHLVKWFNSDLSIDYEMAISYLGVYHSEIKKEHELLEEEERIVRATWYEDYVEKLFELQKHNYKNPYDAYRRAFMAIDKLKEHDFSLSTDSTVNRFHSIITMMPSDFRNFLRYDGKELVCFDIKNSQAFFSLGLFKEESIQEILNVAFDLNKKYQRFYNKNSKPPASCSTSSYILAESLQQIDFHEVERYKDLVLSGNIYEYFGQILKDELGLNYPSRKALKTEFFRIIYSSNKFYGQPLAAPKRVFHKHFPGISEYFYQLKTLYPDIIPILLQRWESHAVLQCITKSISIKYPEVPLFTIHDGISTTSENADLLSTIICEELRILTGYSPKLKKEEWNIKNLKYYSKWIQNPN